ncbi:MAG: shikimate dehydrogenase [Lachnospiraceae bacterium]
MNQKIDAKTRMACFIAKPAKHSSSPAIYNAAFSKMGMNYCYLSFEVPPNHLKASIESIIALDMLGANISMPHKTAAAAYMDKLSPAAEMIGAVNMILNKDGLLEGYNTDGEGFVVNLREHSVDIKGKTVVLAGAGGAASSIAVQLALDGVKELKIFNIRDSFWNHGEELVETIAGNTSCQTSFHDLDDQNSFRKAVAKCDILINGTSVGMADLEDYSIIPDKAMLRPEIVVADVVYHPTETVLLKNARDAGCKTIGGIGMLLYQAAANFRLYTGEEMPVAHVKKVLEIE